MTNHTPIASLSDDELLTEVKRLASAERRATAALVRSLMEVDARRLYLREGCSSLFTYCTQVLHLEEAAAYNRIEVARAARRFPAVLGGLDDGSLTLAAVRLLAPHLTVENHGEVLASARHKSKRDVERLVATLAPRPEAPTLIRKLPARAECTRTPPDVQLPMTQAAAAVATSDTLPAAAPAAPVRTMSPPSPPTVTPVAPERYTVRVTISAATHEKLRRVRDLLRHAMPDGDLEAILDRALTLLLEDVERRRFAATSFPRAARQCEPASRHIPAAVRRQVWRRDGGQCAFVGTHGRCTERGFLEFHHVQPYAAGGAAMAENIELRCKSHNAYEASLFFGVDEADCVREDAVVYSLSDSHWYRSVRGGPNAGAPRHRVSSPSCSRARRRDRRLRGSRPMLCPRRCATSPSRTAAPTTTAGSWAVLHERRRSFVKCESAHVPPHREAVPLHVSRSARGRARRER